MDSIGIEGGGGGGEGDLKIHIAYNVFAQYGIYIRQSSRTP